MVKPRARLTRLYLVDPEATLRTAAAAGLIAASGLDARVLRSLILDHALLERAAHLVFEQLSRDVEDGFAQHSRAYKNLCRRLSQLAQES